MTGYLATFAIFLSFQLSAQVTSPSTPSDSPDATVTGTRLSGDSLSLDPYFWWESGFSQIATEELSFDASLSDLDPLPPLPCEAADAAAAEAQATGKKVTLLGEDHNSNSDYGPIINKIVPEGNGACLTLELGSKADINDYEPSVINAAAYAKSRGMMVYQIDDLGYELMTSARATNDNAYIEAVASSPFYNNLRDEGMAKKILELSPKCTKILSIVGKYHLRDSSTGRITLKYLLRDVAVSADISGCGY